MAPGNQAAKCPRARIKDDGARSSEEPRETTDPTLFRWLNGLRGLAAFLVYWHHHQLWAHDRGLASVMEFAYGFRGQYYFATLTGVRTFFTGGHFAVAVLFTVSGFASSIAPLAACHRGDHARVADVVSSAIARRWFRLYIPLAVTTFAYMCLWYLPGAGPLVRPEWASHSWFDESATWCREFASYSFALGDLTDPWFRYNDHLWSAVLELRGSVLVYLTVLVLAKCTSKTRLGVLLGLMVYFVFIVDGWVHLPRFAPGGRDFADARDMHLCVHAGGTAPCSCAAQLYARWV